MSNHTLKLLKWRLKNDEIQHIRKIVHSINISLILLQSMVEAEVVKYQS